MFKSRAFGLSTLLMALLALVPQARADDFYKGKLFTIVVGFSPAGGYDNYARVLSRYIGNHIPGNPTVIVQNMPGAGSLTSVRYLNLTAPKDGTVMVIFNPGHGHRIDRPAGKDRCRFPQIRLGRRRHAGLPGLLRLWRSGAENLGRDDAPQGVHPRLDRKVLRQLHQRRDACARCSTRRSSRSWAIRAAPSSGWRSSRARSTAIAAPTAAFRSIGSTNGLAHSFVRFTRQRVDEIPESAVYIGTFAKGDEQQQLLNLLNGGDEVGRPFIMSKEVPADHLAIIRKAFDDTMKDPGFLAEMAKQQLPVHPLTGEEAEKIVNELVDVPPAIVAQAKPLYE